MSAQKFLPKELPELPFEKALSKELPQEERQFEVENRMGIHARPAAMIVRIANLYNEVEVYVEKEGEDRINGKSIMALMMLAAGYKTRLRFIAVGLKAKAFLDEVEVVFKRKFEET